MVVKNHERQCAYYMLRKKSKEELNSQLISFFTELESFFSRVLLQSVTSMTHINAILMNMLIVFFSKHFRHWRCFPQLITDEILVRFRNFASDRIFWIEYYDAQCSLINNFFLFYRNQTIVSWKTNNYHSLFWAY